ncbi:substrate-binding domain-containing protein [Mesorhizobium retamae]|uniref:Substrate-binding domain-containing protein n=1 Tax=Mesorhizobium retamae TaxID=2912854 RepID=A0ABS9QD69_9HYPH|nr:substrate-binding domain-containing protein [Mesorhizobium sp. IRAMC:0171]MCG7505368.1 substrate-binding domain-containing protein [Mesorhizobium sp. IRAMC:0171]
MQRGHDLNASRDNSEVEVIATCASSAQQGLLSSQNREEKMRISKCLVLSAILAMSAVTMPSLGLAQEKKPTPRVALSNAYLGNAWRRSMVAAFEKAAAKAKDDGLISSWQVSNAPGENSATEQIAQLKALLLDKPDILIVNPASAEALNPTLQQACNQDAVVVIFDSSTDLKCAHVVSNSFSDWARLSTQAIIDGIGGKGNVLIARGVQGSPPEKEMYAVQRKLLDAQPGIKVVGEVFTFCDAAKAQEALLGIIASLPEVDGVVGCGEGLGAVQAFLTAGRKAPVVAFAPSGRALKFWGEGNGGPGSVAVMSDPGQGVAALFAAIAIYNGQNVPRVTVFPPVVVSDKARDAWIAAVGDDQIASWQWTKELADKQIQANIAGTVDKAALPPVPTH